MLIKQLLHSGHTQSWLLGGSLAIAVLLTLYMLSLSYGGLSSYNARMLAYVVIKTFIRSLVGRSYFTSYCIP